MFLEVEIDPEHQDWDAHEWVREDEEDPPAESLHHHDGDHHAKHLGQGNDEGAQAWIYIQ